MTDTIYDTFYKQVTASFNSSINEKISRFISINNLIIKFNFANNTLVNTIMKPFAHIEIKTPSKYDFTVNIWDLQSTNTFLSYSLIVNDKYLQKDNHTYFYNYKNSHMRFNTSTTILTLIDFNSSQAYYCIDSLSIMPYFEKACPMKMFFHWFSEKNNMSFIHGAIISVNETGYLLTGKSGTGKSTLTLLSYFNNCQLLGDDYVIIDNNNPHLAFSVYNSIKLTKDIIKKYPYINNYIVNNNTKDEKRILFANDIKNKHMLTSLYIKGILFLKNEAALYPHIDNITAIKALSILSASTMYQMPGVNKAYIKNISKLIKTLSIYEYTLSSSIDKNIEFLENFINPYPLISVILPVYNGKKYIKSAIESVLSQTYTNIELLIVDDGSTDKTKDIVSKYISKNVKYIYQKNSGPASARNTALSMAKGDYIAFIDYDDIWYKHKLETQLEYIRSSQKLDAVYCPHKLIINNKKTPHNPDNYNYETISGFLVKSNVFYKIGMFNEAYYLASDFDFFQRLKEANFQSELMKEILFDRLIHNDNISLNFSLNKKYLFKILAESIKRKKLSSNIKISVIITAYNSTIHLLSCIDSILNQSYPPYEIIIIDDGSTTNIKKMIDSYKRNEIKYYYQSNTGISGARNLGINKSSGNYIAIIDHDDVWPENKLQLEITRLLYDSSIVAVFGLVHQFYSPEVDEDYKKKYHFSSEISKARNAGTLLISKKDFLKVGLFNDKIKVGDFIEWISRFDKLNNKYAILPKTLLYRRLHYNNYGITFKENRKDFAKIFAKIIKDKKNERN